MATQKFSRDILEQCTLYTSCEPCLMCTGAFRWSGIRQLVYALSHETLGVSMQLKKKELIARKSANKRDIFRKTFIYCISCKQVITSITLNHSLFKN